MARNVSFWCELGSKDNRLVMAQFCMKQVRWQCELPGDFKQNRSGEPF